MVYSRLLSNDKAEYSFGISVTSVNLGPERRWIEAQPRVFKLFLQPVAKFLQTKFQYRRIQKVARSLLSVFNSSSWDRNFRVVATHGQLLLSGGQILFTIKQFQLRVCIGILTHNKVLK